MNTLYVSDLQSTPTWVTLLWGLWFTFSFSAWWVWGSGLEAYDALDPPVSAPEPTPTVPEPYETKYLARFRAAVEVASNSDTTTEEEWTEDRLCELQHKRIMEYTPLGNVLMYYNHDTESFVYYSDASLPYRYLETVGRKYVCTFRCTHLFVDMEEVLREAEEAAAAKAVQEQEAADANKRTTPGAVPPKRDVFARFKNYNKDTSKQTGAVPVAPKNKAAATANSSCTHAIVKDRANHYTWQGKFLDCPMLQKVDRAKVDKRWGMSFAEFKRAMVAQEKLSL
jgi:hypothetical protein